MILSAAILAGGKATRLNGLNKSEIRIQSKSILDLQIATLEQIFNDIFIISNESWECSKCVTYTDYYKDIGPIAGIHAALKHTKSPFVFVVSNDMPFLSADFIKYLTTKALQLKTEIIVPYHANGFEPLHAIYFTSILPLVEKQISMGDYTIRHLFKKAVTTIITIDDHFDTKKMFFNINYPEDILKANDYAKQ
ncbi:MAG: molybdenum cofactor guanylyltransferase [Bacteroidales bacterium]|nr:molybdenum cofactor guanylyltransferase [Bacteroidales bacterium]